MNGRRLGVRMGIPLWTEMATEGHLRSAFAISPGMATAIAS